MDAAPFTAEIQLAVMLADTDGVTYLSNPYIFGGTSSGTGILFADGKDFYQGRIILGNAYGSELLPLSIPFQVQYYNGSLYVTNTLDNCTVFNDVNHISLTPEPDTLVTTATVTSFVSGVGAISLAIPTPSGITGYVDLEVNLASDGANLTHLQHDWPHDDNADGVHDDNPKARGTFGIYEGQGNIIYIQEVY